MVNPRRSRLAVIVVAVVRPPLFLVVWLYNALFGWWLGPWMNRGSERSFEKEIQQSVPSLFAEHRGRFVPQETPKDFESVTVTVLSEGVLFRFSRWRGELSVKAAPETKPKELQELTALIKSSERSQPSQQPAAYFTLGQFARFLGAHFATIRAEIQDRG